MKALDPLARRFTLLAERLDALSLRERGLIFGAGVTLVYIAWQTLMMGPLTARAHSAEQRLVTARQNLAGIEQMGSVAGTEPSVAAAERNRALKGKLGALDAELNAAAQGYVAPRRVIEMLREILADQHGLALISLSNLPVESLSQAPLANSVAAAAQSPLIAANDRGPFLHPVEIVVDGDYSSVVAYLRALEAMPWRIHWERLELTAGEYPSNRVRIVIGALSLSRDWISV